VAIAVRLSILTLRAREVLAASLARRISFPLVRPGQVVDGGEDVVLRQDGLRRKPARGRNPLDWQPYRLPQSATIFETCAVESPLYLLANGPPRLIANRDGVWSDMLPLTTLLVAKLMTHEARARVIDT
jgi:hypothetical protein